MRLFFYYFILFFVYSVVGWMAESAFVAIKTKKFTNRGFLVGPYCPIYGCGTLIMILYLEQYRDNVITVFILGLVVCAILEYFTSYIMEKLFKARWWDYSDKKFNLNGRVCGENALLFGIGALVVIYISQPFLSKTLFRTPNAILLIITLLALSVFITDVVISLNVVNKFKKTINNIDIKKDSTQDFSKLVSDYIRNNHKIFQKRLMIAFPGIDFNRLQNLKIEIKEEIQEFLKK